MSAAANHMLHAATGGHDHSGGHTVVLVHGAGGNRTQWATQARHLAARGTDVLAIDLPGHGYSPDPACTSVPDYAAAVVADLDARGVGDFAIAGHSLGAMIALQVAASVGSRLTHLALLGAGLALPVNPTLLDATRDDPLTAAAAIVDWGHSSGSHLGSSQTPGLWMDGATLAVLQAEIAAHPGSLHAGFKATAAFDGTDLPETATAPALIIAGQHDRMTPPHLGREVAARLDGSQYVELAGAGHFLMTERPAEVSRALAAFFSS